MKEKYSFKISNITCSKSVTSRSCQYPILLGVLLLFLFSFNSYSQITIWQQGPNNISTSCGTTNSNKNVSIFGNTSAISNSSSSWAGTNIYFVQANTGWDNGSGTKGWAITINTLYIQSLSVSFMPMSYNRNAQDFGPRDFKLQYSLNNSTWTDIGAIYTAQDSWASGIITRTLPSDCNNKSAVYLRWIMASNIATDGGTIRGTGTGPASAMGNITVTGTAIPAAPTDISLSATTTTLWGTDGRTIGILSTTDPNECDPHTYTLISGSGDADNAHYEIAGNTLKVKGEYLSGSTNSIRINTNDGTYNFSKNFTVTINKYNTLSADNNYNRIYNVIFNNINNSSDKTIEGDAGTAIRDGYEDYTSISTSVNVNTSYNLSVSCINDQAASYPYAIKAWIDWNQNGNFEDSEAYELTSASETIDDKTFTKSIAVPASSANGTTRMRIALRSPSSSPDPSTPTNFAPSYGSYDFGEVEDYSINVNAVPTTQAQNLTFPSVQTNQITINWTNGNGLGRALFVKEGTGAITNPSNNTTYIASADWSAKGSQLGASGYYCVYNGTSNSVTLNNLTPGATYTFQVFEYNGATGIETYLNSTSTNNPNTQTTLNTISSITRTSTATTNASSVSWTVTFAGPVTGLTTSNFSLATGTGLTTPSITSVTGSGITWTVTANTGTGDGSLGLNLANSTGTSAVFTNTLPFAGETYTIDKTAPTISSGTLSSGNSYIDVTFSEGIYGASDGTTALTAAKLALTFTKNGGSATNVVISSVKKNDNTAEGSASVLTGGETTVRVFLTITGTPSGTETIEIKPASATSVYDKAGNAALATQTTGAKTLNDKLAPTVTSINRQTPSDATTTATSVVYRVTFSEAVKNVDASDFTLSSAIGAIVSPITTVNSSTYDVTVNSISGTGTLRLDLKSSGTGITDNAGNAISGGFTSGQTYTTSTATWTGTTNTDWSTPTNWAGGIIPTSSTDVIIPSSGVTNYPIIGASTGADCKDLTVNTGASLTIAATASGTGSLIVHGSSTGNITVESYMTGDKWHIVSPPVNTEIISSFINYNSASISSAGTSPFYKMMKYNEASDNWNTGTSGTDADANYFSTDMTSANLESGTGYGLQPSETKSVVYKGALKTGDFTVNVTKNGNGWNCIGNPYSSSLNINATGTAFLTENSSKLASSFACVYIWDQQASYTGSRCDYKIIGAAPISFFNDKILSQSYVAPGQGFFIKAASAGTISFKSAMQSHQNGIAVKAAKAIWPAIRLNVTDNTDTTSTVVAFNNSMSKGLDPSYDAGLLRGTKTVSLYTRLVNDNGTNFAIQCLPEAYDSLIIPIGIDCKETGKVIFNAETSDLPALCNVILEDKATKTFTSLDNGGSYTATVDAGSTGTGRFYLHTSSLSTVTDVPSQNADNAVNAYAKGKVIYITGSKLSGSDAKLYDISGRSINTYKLTTDGTVTLDESSLVNGVYVLHITSSGKAYSFKVILKD